MSNPGKGGTSYFQMGDWDAQCFRCGFKRKASEMRKQWQGYWVCQSCWEPRHPQDFVKAVPDNSAVPWSQPENWNYVGPLFCTTAGISPVCDDAVADCSICS